MGTVDGLRKDVHVDSTTSGQGVAITEDGEFISPLVGL